MTNPNNPKPKLEAVVTNKKFKFIIGTEGNPDYLVVGEHAGVMLAVKPLIGLVPPAMPGAQPKLMVGARIRAARMTHEPGSVVEQDITFGGSKLSFSGAFPGVKWDKEDDVRASKEVGSLIPFTPWVKGSAEKALDEMRYYGKLAELLQQAIGDGEFLMSKEDFMTFIKDKYASHIIDLEKNYPQNEQQVDAEQEIQGLGSLFSTMLSKAKAQQDKFHAAGLSVVDPTDNEE